MGSYTMKCTPVIGMALRSQFKQQLKSYCFMEDIELKMSEEKGFLSSRFLIEINADKPQLNQIWNWMKGLE